MVVSVSIWHTEEATARNLDILHAAGAATARHEGQWILTIDFNATPTEFQKDVGYAAWLVRAAPEAPTCGFFGGRRTLDFFILDRRIAHAVISLTVNTEYATSSNNAVVFRLRSTASRDLVRMLRQPTPLPARRPIGCARKANRPHGSLADRLARPTEALVGKSAATCSWRLCERFVGSATALRRRGSRIPSSPVAASPWKRSGQGWYHLRCHN